MSIAKQLWFVHWLSNWVSSLQVIDIHMKNQWYIEKTLSEKKFIFVVAQFEFICEFCSPICEYICILPLNYMQCLCNAVAPLELDKSGTHTLWTEWSLSLKLNCYAYFAWLRVWSEDGRILANLMTELKLFVAWLCSVVVITWGQAMV